MFRSDRRDLLKLALGVGAGTLLPGAALGKPHLRPLRHGIVIGATKGNDPTTRELIHALTFVDLDSGRSRWIRLGFFPHGLTRDPRDPNRAVIFEKRGPGAAEVDLRKNRFLRPLKTASGRAFYGHGTFSKDGKLLFVAENELASKKGLVSVWDGASLTPLDVFPTYGESPHDCQLIEEGKTLMITNGGGPFPSGDPPCVTLIDVASRKLKEKFTFTNERINAGHVALSQDGHMVVVSAPRDGLTPTDLGGISLRAPKGAMVTMAAPAEVVGGMKGETLSIAIHEKSGVAAVTSPEGDQVSFWDLKKQKLVKSVAIDNPRGVMLSHGGDFFVVSNGANTYLSFFSVKTLEEDVSQRIEKTLISGSHLYPWVPNKA